MHHLSQTFDEVHNSNTKSELYFPLHKKLSLIDDAITYNKWRGAGSTAALEIALTHLKQVQDCADLCQRLMHTCTRMTAGILPAMEKCTYRLKQTCIQYVYHLPTQAIGGALWLGVIDDAD